MVEMERSAPSQAAISVPNVSSLIEFSLGKGKHPCPPLGTFETKIAPTRVMVRDRSRRSYGKRGDRILGLGTRGRPPNRDSTAQSYSIHSGAYHVIGSLFTSNTGSIWVLGKLHTYPSPKPSFSPK